MANVVIRFPRHAETPVVEPITLRVCQGQMVTWQVTSWDPDIDRVKIEFEASPPPPSPPPRFFMEFTGNGDDHNWIERELSRRRGNDPWQGVLWGVAPLVLDSNGEPEGPPEVTYKYTVTGIKTDGSRVVLDPDIITEKP